MNAPKAWVLQLQLLDLLLNPAVPKHTYRQTLKEELKASAGSATPEHPDPSFLPERSQAKAHRKAYGSRILEGRAASSESELANGMSHSETCSCFDTVLYVFQDSFV